jgi:hypothetical protein
MENYFTIIKKNVSFDMIQIDMASQSYGISIPTHFLSYESKEPLGRLLHSPHEKFLYHNQKEFFFR